MLEVLPLDPVKLRADFPILATQVYKQRPLVYLDNAASTQRPRSVIQAMVDAYEHTYANVHRGSHYLSDRSTELYELARQKVQAFLGARDSREIIFTQGTTAGINLVARSWGDANLKAGDEILLTDMEHHSNIVPWQQLAERTGARLRWVPITADAELDLNAFDHLLTDRTKLVAVTAVSNVLGTINPIRKIVKFAHEAGAKVLVDAAQAVPHEPVNVQELGCDFLAFSGHKMLGPTGVGALYGKLELLEAMPPFLGGGSMIRTVTKHGFTPALLPAKFEAGTPPIVPAIALAAAIDYLNKVGLANVHAHEQSLTRYAHELLAAVPGIRFLGPPPEKKAGLVSFVIEGLHPSDIAFGLDQQGIAIRAGHHCAMPLHELLGVSASARASFYLYNTPKEVEQFAAGVKKVVSLAL